MAQRNGADDGTLHDVTDANFPQHSGLDDGSLHNVNDDSGNTSRGTDDVLRGTNADDRLTGRPGDDHMDGGAGTDTAVFHGERATYSITRGSDDIVHVSGQDGSDVL